MFRLAAMFLSAVVALLISYQPTNNDDQTEIKTKNVLFEVNGCTNGVGK